MSAKGPEQRIEGLERQVAELAKGIDELEEESAVVEVIGADVIADGAKSLGEKPEPQL